MSFSPNSMIPISDRIPSGKQPVVVYLIMGINILLFIWEWQLDVKGELSHIINSWGVTPTTIVHVTTAAFTTLNPAAWIAWLLLQFSLVQGLFLHSSFSHLIGNLLFLLVFGKTLENLLGHLKFLYFYLLCGVLTFGLQILVEPTLNLPLIGSNGAIVGVLGAYLYKFPRTKIDTILPLLAVFIPIEIPIAFYLYWWFIQQLFYSIGNLSIHSRVNLFSLGYWMHGIGLVIGIVLMRSLKHK
ncbi:rhomboid family intramembrane serine protease [Scytonema millei]|nr:rhomboid family intramembrane serine protease [Scytonema millei]